MTTIVAMTNRDMYRAAVISQRVKNDFVTGLQVAKLNELKARMRREVVKFAYLKKFAFTKSSDAHFIHIIGEVHCILNMCEPTFEEFRMTLKGEDGRLIDTEPNEKLQLLYG